MISVLIEKIREKNAPVVVGLDPMIDYIPKNPATACIIPRLIQKNAPAGRSGAGAVAAVR